MSNIIDGKKIASEIKHELFLEVDDLVKKGIKPHLSVILVGDDPASSVYVKMKEKACKKIGISSETIKFDSSINNNILINKINNLNSNPNVHGILVQLPLPPQIDEDKILETISTQKDVDGFHPKNIGRLVSGHSIQFIPATPYGIIELLSRYNIKIESRHIVIIGRSNIVGKPLGLLFLRKCPTGNATVSICHSKTKNLKEITKSADILISAIGRANFVDRSMVKQGAVVIDVGISRVEDPETKKGYKIVGDVNFDDVKDIVSFITPVPGGVGPMTIAMLLKNTILAAKNL